VSKSRQVVYGGVRQGATGGGMHGGGGDNEIGRPGVITTQRIPDAKLRPPGIGKTGETCEGKFGCSQPGKNG